jgi:hypothetical protein
MECTRVGKRHIRENEIMKPASFSDVLDPQDLARVNGLELLASRVVDGLLSGKHRSQLKGGSAEFTEHRGYAPGDEIRLIDWKVFGKSDRYFIKQYVEQTCLQVIKRHDQVSICAGACRLFESAGAAPERFRGAGGAWGRFA